MLAAFFACSVVFFADSASWAVSNGEVPPPDASPSVSSSSEPSPLPEEPPQEPSSPEPSPSQPSSTSQSPAVEPSPESSPADGPEAAVMAETTETGATVVTLDTDDAAFFTLALGVIACCSVASLIVSFGRGGS
jgi:hypothetical protein